MTAQLKEYPFRTVQYGTVRYRYGWLQVVVYGTVRFCTVQYRTGTVQYRIVPQNTIRERTGTVPYCT